jgi:hypothetical protein
MRVDDFNKQVPFSMDRDGEVLTALRHWRRHRLIHECTAVIYRSSGFAAALLPHPGEQEWHAEVAEEG